MSDVIKTIKTGSGVEGEALVYVDKFGNKKTLTPTINYNLAATNKLTAISGILTNRFDDVT